MADLGNIKRTPVTQGQTIVNDRAADIGAIGSAVNLGTKVVTEVIEADVRGDLDAALLEGIQEAEQAPTVPELSEASFQGWDLSPEQLSEVVDLSNQVRSAQTMLQQATRTEVRQLALMRMQRAQAKARSKYGFMADQIDQLATRVASTSPELTAAEMRAASSNAARKASQDYIDRIAKQGYDELGIPATYTVGSPEFMAMYTERQRDHQRTTLAEQRYSMLLATGALENKGKLEFTVHKLQSETSDFSRLVRDPIIEYVAKLDRTRAGDLKPSEVAKEFQDFIPFVNQMERRAVVAKQKARGGFQEVWGTADIEGREYKSAKAALDNYIADIDLTMSMLKAGDLDVVDYLKEQSTIRGAALIEDIPTLGYVADLSTQGPELFKTLRELDHTNQFPLLGIKYLENIQTEMGLAGHLKHNVRTTENVETPEQRALLRDQADSRDPKSGGLTETTDPVERGQELFVPLIAQTVTGATTPSAIAEPAALELHLTGIAGGLQRVHREVQVSPDLANRDISEPLSTVTSYLTGDTFWERMKTADRDLPGARDFQHQLENALLRSVGTIKGLMPSEQTAENLKARAMQERYGKSLQDFFTVDVDAAVNEDRLVFELDEQAARTAIEESEKRKVEERALRDKEEPDYRRFDVTVDGRLAELKRQVNQLSKDATTYARLVALTNPGPLSIDSVFVIDEGTSTNFVDIFKFRN